MFGRKPPMTPGEQAQLLVNERGDIWTNRGYTSLPIVIHPNDRYVRVPPGGPFDQAWQGIQKDNPVAHLGTSFADIANPLQTQALSLPYIQQNNPTAMSVGAGPALAASQQNQYAAAVANQRPSLTSSIMRRIRGR